MNIEDKLPELEAKLKALPVSKSGKPHGNAVNKVVDLVLYQLPEGLSNEYLDKFFAIVRKYRR